MNVPSIGSNSPRSFTAYPRPEFDLESLNFRNPKRAKSTEFKPAKMIKSFTSYIKYYYKNHPFVIFFLALLFGITVLIFISVYESRIQATSSLRRSDVGSESYPYYKLKNLVMVAGHSVYTSGSCGKFDSEDSWLLESYQKHPGQAATFVDHVKEGVEVAAKDDASLLLFSGGETRKDAGPRSEAQSYWFVADSKSWFGEKESVRWRAQTEEHARDSFENLLFSICRFRELTGAYPQNITGALLPLKFGFGCFDPPFIGLISYYTDDQVVSYDFKAERFTGLHRSAIGFPESNFFYVGTPASSTAREAAQKGEELVRAQFKKDPFGCMIPLHQKKLGRDPFHRSIPYPKGCPEIRSLFRYCGTSPYAGALPWV